MEAEGGIPGARTVVNKRHRNTPISVLISPNGTRVKVRGAGRAATLRSRGYIDEDAVATPATIETAMPSRAGELLAWVGSDIDRALAALEAEQSRKAPRKSIIDTLEKLIADLAE